MERTRKKNVCGDKKNSSDKKIFNNDSILSRCVSHRKDCIVIL